MTGHGEAQYHDGDVSYTLELRSVNSRYFKASIRLPDHLGQFETDVDRLLRARIVRGSVTCNWRIRDNSARAAQEINVAALRQYVEQLSQVQMDGAMRLDLATVVNLPGVCQPPEIDESDFQRQGEIVRRLTNEAIDRLIEMRKVEGKALRDDLLGHCRRIRASLQEVAERAPKVLTEYHERLLNRVSDLLRESKLDLHLDDLRREVAVYADRCDINEEVSRLRSHLDQVERLCNGKEHTGRKLDFLAQEMLREANTIGSKSNDAEITHYVVEIKGAIDRVKEQVQNVE
jgi:uncharacterized protein (TIGR00255 family)